MNERGKIRNREYAEQGRDFSNMRFGNITPTDLDGIVDYKNKLFVIIEAKHDGADMPFGQRLAFERLVDGLIKGGLRAVGMVIDHDTPPDRPIDFGPCLVRKYYAGDDWHPPKEPIQANSAVGRLIAQIEGRPL